MGELVIEFTPGGHVAAMHMDTFDLGFLGDKEIKRQTDIPFNPVSQTWSIYYILDNGTPVSFDPLRGFEGYDRTRKFEVMWLNECRLLGVCPVAEEGIDAAATLREAYGS